MNLILSVAVALLMAAPARTEAPKAPNTPDQAPAAQENALINEYNAMAGDLKGQKGVLLRLIAVKDRFSYELSLGDVDFRMEDFAGALAAYDAALARADQAKNDPAVGPERLSLAVAQVLTAKANALLRLKRNPEALDALAKAAEIAPNSRGAFNLCAVAYNIGDTARARTACDKATVVDPQRADAWFIKGSLLVGEAAADKSGKITAPPGAVEALRKYLELAPDGPHAGDVKAMLDALGVAP